MSSVHAAVVEQRDRMIERILRDYEAVAAELPDAAVGRDTRVRATRELTRLGWPSARDEQWRYAHLSAFERVPSFKPVALTEPAEPVAAPTLPEPLPGFERQVFIDGVRARGNVGGLQQTAVGTETPAWSAAQRFGLLGDMFAADAATLHVREAASVELLFVNSAHVGPGAAYPRIIVHLEPGSRLTLVERHLGGAGGPGLVAGNTSIVVGRGAQLTHYRLQQCDTQVLIADTLSARLEDDASYHVRHVAIGAAAARTSAQVELAGRGSAVSWQAIAVGRAEQVHDTALKVLHLAPGTRTEEVFRGIADERSRIAFSGHVHIGAQARGAEARQSLRGLIEGARAEIDLRPRLEIQTDEVKAQHGATTGRLDDNLLFYLLSRGIEPSVARALLKWAFLGDVLRAIELPALRSAAEHAASGQLPDLLAIGALT